MGVSIDRAEFSDAEFAQFADRLQTGLSALERLLVRPGFGDGPRSIGAELELCLVDGAGQPLPRNADILATARHPRLTVEADRFNLECNTAPVPFGGRPFRAMADDLTDVLAAVRAAAAPFGGRPVMIGILPTLRERDLRPAALTETFRYRALSNGLRRLRQAPFPIRLHGAEPLTTTCDDVTFEGANTSWQVHLKIPLADFVRTFNAAQIACAPVLAVASNAPTFLGHRLWDETRIALYRQSVDERLDAVADDWRPARVSFGHGWVRSGPLELFAESVAMHPPLAAPLSDEDALAEVARGAVPQLPELRLHHGTVWRWNRAVYDPTGGGHVRIEMRPLPAGPTIVDMLANAAFLLGLTLSLAADADRLVTRITFGQARRNFYAAARDGIDAELLWPSDTPPSPRGTTARALVPQLLPRARAALVDAGVDAADVDPLLAIIGERTERGLTGARWQCATLAHLERRLDRPAALAALLARYQSLSDAGTPVYRWPVEA
jgi:hypothetical protein